MDNIHIGFAMLGIICLSIGYTMDYYIKKRDRKGNW